ncbi:GntP family permease [Kytococcus sedentarius]|uniref:GntP family permease n=1 Tax=Kytococcus sedentarius TaxID=1276 RepID=UPI0035BC2625
MLGLIGVVLSLALLIYFAYKGYSIILLAPVTALVAGIFAGAPLMAMYTQVFMPAMGGFLITYFPLFLLGALFGKLMNDSGSAYSIARFIVERVGAKHAVLAVVTACGILAYGGVTVFVVVFAIWPIARELFQEAGIPKRFAPAAIALGSFSFAMTAIPGTPQIQNAIPAPYFQTDAFAAPGLGLIAGAIMYVGGVVYLNRRVAAARAKGEGYDDGALMQGEQTTGIGQEEEVAVPTTTPFWVAMLPIVLVITLNFLLVRYIFDLFDFSYLAEEKFRATSIDKVGGIWAIIISLLVACLLVLALNWNRLRERKKLLNQGAASSFLPIMNTASEVGYGAVIAALPAFAIIRDGAFGVSSNPAVSLAVSTNIVAGITGSASGGLSIAMNAFGAEYAAKAAEVGIDPEFMHRVASLAAGGFDALPHNGAVITVLAVTGLTHRQSYKDIGVVCVLIPIVALAVVLALGSAVGSF